MNPALPRRGGLGSVFARVVQRDLLLAVRRRSDVAERLFLFIIVVSLFPLGVGPEPNTLRSIAPGVVWVAALLASMLALGRLFAGDYADGTLEQLALSPQPLLRPGAGEDRCALAGDRCAPGPHRTRARAAVRSVRRGSGRDDARPPPRHADPVDDRSGGCGPDPGCARCGWAGERCWSCRCTSRCSSSALERSRPAWRV